MGFVGFLRVFFPLCGANIIFDSQRWFRQLMVDDKYLRARSGLPWPVVCAAELGTVQSHQHCPVPRLISGGGESQA